MKKLFTILTIGACLGMGAHAFAHHGLTGIFDMKNIITMKGEISDVKWINPHIYLILDVTDEAGSVSQWRVESVPVAMARKAGLNKASMMGAGGIVEVTGWKGHNDHLMFGNRIKYADGHEVIFANVGDTDFR
jgi:hypothetical protein